MFTRAAYGLVVNGRGILICALAGGGCVVGGGPYVAYGAGRLSGGFEAGGGFGILQANLGIDTDTHPYLRGDVVAYLDELASHGPRVGGRVGGGVWLDDDRSARGLFVVGAGGSTELHAKPCIAETIRTHDLLYSAVFEIELRYAGAWLVVLAGRLDASAPYCERT